ncbi:MAG: hypothetical protein AB7T06_27645 [Kofleriaceae bacterium]
MKRNAYFLASLSLLVATTASADQWRRPHRPRPDRPPPLDLGRLQAITSACQNAFEGPANEQSCVQTVSAGRARFDVVPAIRACENAFEGDANELACVAIAVDAKREPSGAINACENAFEGDANELTCLRTMTSSRLSVSAVSACENAFDGDANEQACLDTLVGSRYDAAQLVTFCEQNYDGDANELSCLGMYR